MPNHPPPPLPSAAPQVIFMVGVQCARPPLPDTCPAALAALIRAAWSDSPCDRPSFNAIMDALRGMMD